MVAKPPSLRENAGSGMQVDWSGMKTRAQAFFVRLNLSPRSQNTMACTVLQLGQCKKVILDSLMQEIALKVDDDGVTRQLLC